MKNIFTITVLSFIIFTFLASDIFAIPAFARKYNMSCKTCHSPFPYLKAYGNDFAGNGFQLKDKDAPRYYVETGDDKLSLLRDFPLAVRLEGYVTYNQGNTEQSDFTTPLLFKLLTGGAITKDVAYYVYYILESGEPGKIEDAWIMFNNMFGSELDFTIGQFQVCDPLFKRELRLTRDDYYIYKVRPGNSMVDLTYDRGIMLNYGFESGTDLTLEVVNGSGIGESFLGGNFDNDKYKNVFVRISQDAGDHLRLGAMGYWGKERRELTGDRYPNNELWMLGGDATIIFDPLELNLQYVERNDDNPYFNYPDKEKIKTRGAFGELIFRPEGDESEWYGVALFNWIESDQTDLNLKQLGIHFGYLLRRNIRLVAEYSQNFTAKYGTIGLGFVTAF
ncbi:MAG: hypothetical protein OQJ93_06050 [Ignavibacteriaceae bacterium]|jgi:hypothetical protein|nr:hypothetical protein [Ignavibacteriaceae bacterium]MCW8816832.1 hypothetical protein [Ignavibacteriaceae bacterium]MCW8960148.1 hypothetical protein [Ignavibacteriaceae bacterium]MCW9096934.1 hypothetical protein [Ignavibacteriaceae bacterium]